MTNASYGIAITADDRTDKGARSAERRIGRVSRTASAVNRRALTEDERRFGRHARSVVRTFGEVERAGAQIFGGRSITGGIAGRLGAVRAAAAATGTGLGEAAASSSMLGSALGTVGVVAGATVGILAAAGYAAVSFAGNWAKGAADIGRTAATIGLSTKALQEFEAASQRAGLEKGVGTGALGGLSETLNDARYGRNTGALATLGRLGVAMKTNADGTVDVEGMLPALADAIARQNSAGKRLAASNLGIPLGALAVFAQGGKALGSDMRDANAHAAVLSDADIATGTRINRKGAMVSQLKDRALAIAGAGTAGAIEGGYDLTLSGGQALTDGSKSFGTVVRDTFRPAAVKIDRAADKMVAAASGRGARGAGRFSRKQIDALARRALPLVSEAQRHGFSDRNEAVAVAANVMLESGGNHRAREKGGNGRGLIQWTDRRRKELFRRVMGVDVEHADRATQWRFMRWETQHSEASNWRRAHRGGNDAGSLAAGYARYVERPANKDRDSAERAAVADAMTIKLEVSGLPQGTKVKAVGGSGARPAVSHAFAR